MKFKIYNQNMVFSSDHKRQFARAGQALTQVDVEFLHGQPRTDSKKVWVDLRPIEGEREYEASCGITMHELVHVQFGMHKTFGWAKKIADETKRPDLVKLAHHCINAVADIADESRAEALVPERRRQFMTMRLLSIERSLKAGTLRHDTRGGGLTYQKEPPWRARLLGAIAYARMSDQNGITPPAGWDEIDPHTVIMWIGRDSYRYCPAYREMKQHAKAAVETVRPASPERSDAELARLYECCKGMFEALLKIAPDPPEEGDEGEDGEDGEEGKTGWEDVQETPKTDGDESGESEDGEEGESGDAGESGDQDDDQSGDEVAYTPSDEDEDADQGQSGESGEDGESESDGGEDDAEDADQGESGESGEDGESDAEDGSGESGESGEDGGSESDGGDAADGEGQPEDGQSGDGDGADGDEGESGEPGQGDDGADSESGGERSDGETADGDGEPDGGDERGEGDINEADQSAGQGIGYGPMDDGALQQAIEEAVQQAKETSEEQGDEGMAYTPSKVEPTPSQKSGGKWNDRSYTSAHMAMTSAIEAMMSTDEAMAKRGANFQGHFLNRRWHRVYTDGRVFKTPDEAYGEELRMAVLLDNSGSMGVVSEGGVVDTWGDRQKNSRIAHSAATARAFCDVAVDHGAEVKGWIFGTGYCELRDHRDFNTRIPDVGGGTDAYPSIVEACDWLGQKRKGRKVIVILTDGGTARKEECGKALVRAKIEHNVEILIIGIDMQIAELQGGWPSQGLQFLPCASNRLSVIGPFIVDAVKQQR